MLLLNYSVGSVLHYYGTRVEDKSPLSIGWICTLVLFLPLCGWLADVYFGRYKVIRVDFLVMWISSLLNVVCVIVSTVSHSHVPTYTENVLLFILFLGLAGYQANIIQFGIDQLLDALSDEITSFIVWYVWTFIISNIFVNILTMCISKDYQFVGELIIAVIMSLTLCLDFLFNNWLIKEPPMQNPFKLVLNVIRYAIKTKYPQHRSAFTYCENELPSRIDFGKHKYGGPLTTEQVEDVKTFLRLAIVIAVGAFVVSTSWILEYPQQRLVSHLQGWNYTKGDFSPRCERTTVVDSDILFVACFIPLYEFVLYPLFKTCMPHIGTFKKFTIGVVLFFIRITVLLIIEAFGQVDNRSSAHCIFTDAYQVTNTNYYVSVFLGVVMGLSSIMLFIAPIELICSHAVTLCDERSCSWTWIWCCWVVLCHTYAYCSCV